VESLAQEKIKILVKKVIKKFFFRKEIGLLCESDLEGVWLAIQRYPVEIFRLESGVEKDIETVMALKGWRTKKIIEQRFKKGDICYVAKLSSRLVGFGWWVLTEGAPIPYFNYLRLKKEEAYGYDFFVIKAFRGRGIMPQLIEVAAKELARKGYHKLLAGTFLSNQSSLRALKKSNFSETHHIVEYRRILWFESRHFPKGQDNENCKAILSGNRQGG